MQGFILKRLLKSKLKGIPEDEQNRIIEMIEENPELFKKIAEEAKKSMDSGKDMMTAISEASLKFKDDIERLRN